MWPSGSQFLGYWGAKFWHNKKFKNSREIIWNSIDEEVAMGSV